VKTETNQWNPHTDSNLRTKHSPTAGQRVLRALAAGLPRSLRAGEGDQQSCTPRGGTGAKRRRGEMGAGRSWRGAGTWYAEVATPKTKPSGKSARATSASRPVLPLAPVGGVGGGVA